MILQSRFTIPMERDRLLTFREWLPLRNEDALRVSETAGIELRFWIDKSCLDHVGDIDIDAIHSYGNLFIGKIYVHITGITVSDQLADAIPKLASEKNWLKDYINSTYGTALIEEYQSTGAKIYQMVIYRFNRLIAYARAVKGQYWLQEYKIDADNIYSELVKLQAEVKIGEANWVALRVPASITFTAMMPTGELLIGKEDWQDVQEFVAGERKVPLVGQLLASADEFRQSGERRVALTEAVSALDIAIAQFAERATPEKWTATVAGRASAAHFKNHVEHLGMTCTVEYLLPIIFSEEQVSASILKSCLDAINERNTVIHRGQRDVDSDKLRGYLHAIRELCHKLRQFQAGDAD